MNVRLFNILDAPLFKDRVKLAFDNRLKECRNEKPKKSVWLTPKSTVVLEAGNEILRPVADRGSVSR